MSSPAAFIILADEAATWRIAGLSQLDRLVLALNESAETQSPEEIVSVVMFWQPEIPSSSRWLPRHPKITRVRMTEAVDSVAPGAQVLTTRLFVERDGLTKFLEQVAPITLETTPQPTASDWNALNARFETGSRNRPEKRDQLWQLLGSAADIGSSEERMLRRTGKSQDGLISRFLNRPLSRRLSRYLLRYDIAPTAWTAYAFALPLLGFVCLSIGSYMGIAAGALIFQIYSIVDGCDGEIARATYGESQRGGRIDDFLDMVGSMLFVVGLGLGLFRSRSSVYLLEGLVCAGIIAVNEWSLRRVKSVDEPQSDELQQALYPRHRRLFAGRVVGILNERLLWWLLQFTKRDVAIFAFLVLAWADQSPWILHLWLIVSAGTLGLSMRSSIRQKSAVQAGP